MTGQTNCNSCSEPLTTAELDKGPGDLAAMICGKCRRSWRAQCRDGWSPVMQWEKGGIEGGLRLASKAPIPWQDRKVTLINVTHTGEIRVTGTLTGKRAMLAEPAEGMLLAAWPGAYRQDIFIVDDRRAALKAVAR